MKAPSPGRTNVIAFAASLAASSSGKGGRRREVGMDDWAWEQMQPWLAVRRELPVGPLFCIINGAAFSASQPGGSC